MRTSYGAGVTVSGEALKAWQKVPRDVIDEARLLLPKNRRPSLEVTTYVGWLLAHGVKPSTGYTDLTQQQLVELTKGAWGVDAVKSACQALHLGGVFVVVKRGHQGKEGEPGSGSWRVLSTHDTHQLIKPENSVCLSRSQIERTRGDEWSNTEGLEAEHGVPDPTALRKELNKQAPAPAGALVSNSDDDAPALELRHVWDQPRVSPESADVVRLKRALLTRCDAKSGTRTHGELETYALDIVTLFPDLEPSQRVQLAHKAYEILPRGSRSERWNATAEAAACLDIALPNSTGSETQTQKETVHD